MPNLYDSCLFTREGLNVLQIACIPILFQQIIYWLLLFGGIIALFFVIFSGIKFITSGGDPKQAEGARKTLTYAIIGLMLILLSFGIVRFIADMTGVNCITMFGISGDSCK